MSWTEIVIDVAREEADALSDALMEAHVLSVSIEDADVGTDAERPLFGEPGMEPETPAWDRSRVVALTDAGADHARIVSDAAAAIGLAPVPSYRLRPVAEQDWVTLTQSQFDPIRVGRRIWVVPSWHDAPEPDAVVLALDPGLAFGTGSHPTTRLCMEWLEAHLPAGAAVLDYGCGSGILAILAKKLGAGPVCGVDIDPQAIQAARRNGENNRCDLTACLPDAFTASFPASTFDIVIANILAGPLTVLAPLLCARIADGGRLALSGILAQQADDVIAAYRPFLDMAIRAEADGWVVVAGQRERRPAAAPGQAG